MLSSAYRIIKLTNTESRIPGCLNLFFDEYMDKFNFDKDDALMIGDASGKTGQFSDSDKKTAENFGIDYLDVEDFVSVMNAAPCFSEDK